MPKIDREGGKVIPDTALDVEFCRHQFPALNGEWVFLENAGGTLVPQQVIYGHPSDCKWF